MYNNQELRYHGDIFDYGTKNWFSKPSLPCFPTLSCHYWNLRVDYETTHPATATELLGENLLHFHYRISLGYLQYAKDCNTKFIIKVMLNRFMFNKFNWDRNAQNINLFRIIGPGPALLLTSFSSNPGKAFARKGNLSLWCSDPSWDSQLTSGSINNGWGSCH